MGLYKRYHFLRCGINIAVKIKSLASELRTTLRKMDKKKTKLTKSFPPSACWNWDWESQAAWSCDKELSFEECVSHLPVIVTSHLGQLTRGKERSASVVLQGCYPTTWKTKAEGEATPFKAPESKRRERSLGLSVPPRSYPSWLSSPPLRLRH